MRRFLCAAVWCFAIVGCGTSDESATKPPTPAYAFLDAGDPEAGTERYLNELTQSERDTLCDWAAATLGGYGKVTACDGSSVVNFKDRSACISQYLGGCMSVTVLGYEACIKLVGSNVCGDALYKSRECLGVYKCIGKTDGGPPPEPVGDGG